MMVFKWVVYAIAIKPDIFSEMFNAIVLRFSANNGTEDISRFEAVGANISIAIGDLWWNLIEIGFVLFCFVKLFAKRKGSLHISVADAVFMIIMAFLPIARYFIYANHVFIHSWVTYRILLLTVMTFNVLIVKVKKDNELVKC